MEYKYKSTLKQHLQRKHVADSDKKFQCDICGSSTSNKACMRTHVATHADAPRVKCSLCDKTYKNERFLKQHMWIHREANFECPVCFKSFTGSDGLSHHKKVHFGNI